MQFLKRNSITKLPIIIIGYSALLVACGQIQNIDNNGHGEEKASSISYRETAEDLRIAYNDVEELDLDKINEDIHIVKGGDYLLHGNYADTIYISANEYPVHLFFDGVNIESSRNNAIYIESASKVVITCLQGTVNNISDNAYYQDSNELACVFSESDITFNGEGTIDILGICDDGIHSKDSIKVLNANMNVHSKGNGIKGNDGIYIDGSTLIVEAEKSGLLTSKYVKGKKGNIEISDSNITVIGGEYCVSSSGDIIIDGVEKYFKGIWGEMKATGEIIIDGVLFDD